MASQYDESLPTLNFNETNIGILCLLSFWALKSKIDEILFTEHKHYGLHRDLTLDIFICMQLQMF